jgi:inner membrane transporter RhtA
MTTKGPPGRVPPWALAVTATLPVQLGSALPLDLMADVGAAGTAWLRLTLGAVIFLTVASRPRCAATAGTHSPVLSWRWPAWSC